MYDMRTFLDKLKYILPYERHDCVNCYFKDVDVTDGLAIGVMCKLSGTKISYSTDYYVNLELYKLGRSRGICYPTATLISKYGDIIFLRHTSTIYSGTFSIGCIL